MKRVVCLVTFLALSVAVSHVHAQPTGDSREGLTLARQVCSKCHAIRRGQVRSPNSRAPTFFLRACNRSWNDDRCPIRGAYDAACGDANVQVYD